DRVFPRELGALVADESAIVVGRIAGDVPKKFVIRGSGGEQETSLTVRTLADDGDLRRRWAEGRLSQLLDEGAGRAGLVGVGMIAGIITPFTSLYVPTDKEHRRELDRVADVSSDYDEKRWWRYPWFSTRSAYEERVYAAAEVSADNKEGGTGTRAKGEEGSMG